MPLEPGQKLASYEILAPLGAGGMGEVWRARDTRLGRDVAIKALPEAFARDPERMARFEREAKLLASVNHANIGAIYGLEVVDGHRYLVLEFLEGETLTSLLSRGSLPVAEAIEICGQVAGALEAAHEAGIVHRDLKPGNVMILKNGAVKVLDFGLAKADGAPGSSSDMGASASPTMTYGATQAGMVLGTAAYMSPEQARGRVVDRRTDIWSFGCVLFECLTGKQAFAGETVSDLIAHILTSEPDWNALPQAAPPRIRDLLRRCLEKDARRRLRDMGDARLELEETLAPRGSSSYGVPASIAANVDVQAAKSRKFGRWLQAGALVLAALAGAIATKLLAPPKESARPAARFAIVENDTMKIFAESGNIAFSPDGSTLAFIAGDSTETPLLWVRPLASLAPRALHGTENAQLPFFSPDGQSIGFFTETKLKKVSLATGDVDEIADVKRARGGDWNKANQILFAPTSDGPLFVVSASGGDARQVTQLDSLHGEAGQRFPSFLPDGRHFLYTSLPPREGRYKICIGDLNGGKPDSIAALPTGARYAPPGWLVYASPIVLYAQGFDLGSRKLRGPAIPMREQVLPTSYSGSPEHALAGTGAMAFLQFPPLRSKLVWLDATGREIGPLPFASGLYAGSMAFSPDGRKLAFARSEGLGGIELWIGDAATGAETRFESEPLQNLAPSWSPDGSRLAWMHGLGGPQHFFVRNADGSGEKKVLVRDDPAFKSLDGWTPDGKSLLFDRQHPSTRWDLWTVDVADGKARPLIAGPYNESNGQISPDGKWITYLSDETGRNEVYVQPYPSLGSRVQVTTTGGQRTGWTPKGQLSFAYTRTPYEQMVADVLPGAEFHLGPARAFFHAPQDIEGGTFTPDGRFAAQLPAGRKPGQTIVVLLDWPSALPRP